MSNDIQANAEREAYIDAVVAKTPPLKFAQIARLSTLSDDTGETP